MEFIETFFIVAIVVLPILFIGHLFHTSDFTKSSSHDDYPYEKVTISNMEDDTGRYYVSQVYYNKRIKEYHAIICARHGDGMKFADSTTLEGLQCKIDEAYKKLAEEEKEEKEFRKWAKENDFPLSQTCNTIEVNYRINSSNDCDEGSFDMNVSERIYNWLEDADSAGEILDSEYISDNKPGLHRKIQKAIKENMTAIIDDEEFCDIEYDLTV